MTNIDAQIQICIDSYDRLIRFLQHLAECMQDTQGDSLKQMIEELTIHQDNAAAEDQTLAKFRPDKTKLPAQTLELLAQLAQRVRTAYDLNREIKAAAGDSQVMLAHDIRTVQQGASALSGYKPNSMVQGKIVNRKS